MAPLKILIKTTFPVIKLFLPGTRCAWLLTEVDPEEPTLAFGLCDLGQGFPELGYVDLEEIGSVRIHGMYKVECDFHFIAKYPISVYAQAAKMAQVITEDDEILKQTANK